MPEALMAIAVAVLFFAAADLSRRSGKAIERRLFNVVDGRPVNTELYRRDQTLDNVRKDRYRAFLAEMIDLVAPTEEQETRFPEKAAQFYDIAFAWLRENTRSVEMFPLVFAENVTYGFRRNLLGLKRIGISLNAVSFAVALIIYWFGIDVGEVTPKKLLALALLSSAHMAYFILAATEDSVRDASKRYASQLLLACETLRSQSRQA